MIFSKNNNDALIASLTARIDMLEQEIKQLKTMEADQKHRLEALDLCLHAFEAAYASQQDDHDAGTNIGLTPSVNKANENQVVRDEISELYLPAPSPDGIFEQASISKQVGKSIYLLKTKDQVNGTFSILEDKDSIATAMISISQFIKPVCRIEGDTHRYPQKVSTLEEGVVRKEGNSWHLVSKARLLFEDR